MDRIKQELENLKAKGQLRKIPGIDAKADGKVTIDGIEYINFASNDYLGLSTKDSLRQDFFCTNNALMSTTSARLLTGNSLEYKILEKTVADLFHKEAALIFNTGYQCNLGVISALTSRGDVVFSDKLNHASIIDGMQLSGAEFFRYKHFDYNHLEQLLQAKRHKYKRAIIVSESVFSMDGDTADIDKLVEIKNKYNCLLMIDEAHAFCSCGKGLAGLSESKDVDIITATFGKAVASFGAFCVSNNEIIEYLINKARSFIFSTSIPPINIAWSNWLLNNKREYLIKRKDLLQKLVHNAHRLLNEYGFSILSKSHIIPIIIGDNVKTLGLSEKLRLEGYYVPAIRPPTVPEGTSRLRISLTADCNPDDFKNLLQIIAMYDV